MAGILHVIRIVVKRMKCYSSYNKYCCCNTLYG